MNLRRSWERAYRRATRGTGPALQGTLAALIALVLARDVLRHPDPFFAPIAAVIGLNASLGERGTNALRLLLGVGLGIAVGELAVLVLGSGYVAVALAILVAMTLAQAVGSARIVTAQAASSAVLTVSVAGGEAGLGRLADALIGVGVALTFSQVLFSPEPLGLLRRAQTDALADLAAGLRETALALERGDLALAERALDTLRGAPGRLTELARLRRASGRVARHSLLWRSQQRPVVREKARAEHLDLLAGSALLLARTALTLKAPERQALAPAVRELADSLTELAGGLGDRAARQRAADRALEVASRCADGAPGQPARSPALMAVEMVAVDVMLFAGVPAEEVAAALRERGDRAGRLEVLDPPPAPRVTFRRRRR